MWRKPEEPKPQAAPEISVSPTPAPAREETAPSVSPKAAACISQGITIKGEITGREDLFLDGTLEGRVHLADGNLTVGPNGRVTANLDAREITVRGRVKGALHGSERVSVWPTGRVAGDIRSRRLAIEEGAVLHGKIEVVQDRTEFAPARPSAPAARTPAFVPSAVQAKEPGR